MLSIGEQVALAVAGGLPAAMLLERGFSRLFRSELHEAVFYFLCTGSIWTGILYACMKWGV